jgi:hypothetical protein
MIMAHIYHHSAIGSPFALMFPEAVNEILEHAEKMALPRHRFSPLSKGSPLTERNAMMETEEDFGLGDDALDAFDAIADSGHDQTASVEDNEDDF